MYLPAPTRCVLTSPSTFLTGSLTCTNITCKTIKYNTAIQPTDANYLGYSIMTILGSLYNLNYGVYNNIMLLDRQLIVDYNIVYHYLIIHRTLLFQTL